MSSSAQLLSLLPPGQNPFTFLRTYLRSEITPNIDESWTFPVLYATSGILAVLTILLLLGFFARWRSDSLWFVRTVQLPAGPLYCPHPTNGLSLFALVFTILAQGEIWSAVHTLREALDDGNPAPFLRAFSWQTYYLALFFAGWADMGGGLTGVITSRFRKHRTVPRWANIWAIHFFIFVLPVLLAIGFGVLFGLIAQRTNTLLDASAAVDAQLAADEPTWTSGLPLAQLLALEPMGDAALAARDSYISILRITFYYIAAWAVLLWMVWLPANILQIMALYQQIRHLRHTVRHEVATNKEEGSHARASRISFTMSRRNQSSVEKQTRGLIHMCWQRIVVATVLTLITSYYVFLALITATDPSSTLTTRWRCETLVVGANLGYVAVGIFVNTIFFLRSFDAYASHANRNPTTGTAASGGSQLEQQQPRTMSMMQKLAAPMRSKTLQPGHQGALASYGRTSHNATPALMVQVDIDSAVQVDVDDDLRQQQQHEEEEKKLFPVGAAL